jgi:hypothetical protein
VFRKSRQSFQVLEQSNGKFKNRLFSFKDGKIGINNLHCTLIRNLLPIMKIQDGGENLKRDKEDI